jgi:hypothetical protein
MNLWLAKINHLTVREVSVRGFGNRLPPCPVVQYDCFTQVLHRQHVLMGIEKDLSNRID